ncbi:MAG: hypothetical protein ACOCRK_00970 [bacterium]
MNEQTKEAYKYFFKEQLKTPIVVDNNILNRELKTIFGNEPLYDDKLLYCMIAKDVTNEEFYVPEVKLDIKFFMYPQKLDIKFFMYPQEFEHFIYKYQFSRFSPTNNRYSIPIFTERNNKNMVL